jgi:hypothetical protein
MVYDPLEASQRPVQRTIGGQETVVDHLARKTALEVEDERNTPQTT